MHSDDVKRFISLGQPHLLPTGLSTPSLGQHERPILSNAASALSTFAAILEAQGSTATALGCRLMLEELGETIEAVLRGDVAEFADGLADLLYVTLWSAVVHGVPIEAVFAVVQRANLAKFPVCSKCAGTGWTVNTTNPILSREQETCAACGGKGRVVIRDAAGKVKKPEGWTPPDIREVLWRAEVERQFPGAEASKASPDWRSVLTPRDARAVELLGPRCPVLLDGCPGKQACPQGTCRVEERAQQVYAEWLTQAGWVPWVPGGNSTKQSDARAIARRMLNDEAAKASPAPGPNPVPAAEIIPWTQRPDWLVDLFANSAEVADETKSPEMTDVWWRQDWRKVDGAWALGPRQSAEGWLAHDPGVVLLAPVGAVDVILDCISETFGYGSPVYWTEANTPYGRRLIALLTDS